MTASPRIWDDTAGAWLEPERPLRKALQSPFYALRTGVRTEPLAPDATRSAALRRAWELVVLVAAVALVGSTACLYFGGVL